MKYEGQMNTSQAPKRYFYHSFPRRKLPGIDSYDQGLRILSSMVKHGLLLVPEVRQVASEFYLDGSRGPDLFIQQKRISFTELRPDELRQHGECFGYFAIEFEIEVLRALCAMPVIYIPEPIHTGGNNIIEGIGSTFVYRLGEIEDALVRLAILEQNVNSLLDNESLQMKIPDRSGSKERCTIRGAKHLVRWLRGQARPFEELLNAIRAFEGLFYPADDMRYTDMLGYYRQREWRIMANIINWGVPLSRSLDEKMKQEILSTDSEFFGEEIRFRSGLHRRIDQCQVVGEIEGKHILSHACRVIVPDAVVDAARRILEPIIDASNVVSLCSMEG